MSVLQAVRYGVELAPYIPVFRAEIEELKLADSVTVGASDCGSAIFGAAIYDLSTDQGKPDRLLRAQSRRLGGLSMFYMNLLDDAIDDPVLALTATRKRQLITDVVGATWGSSSEQQVPLPTTSYFDKAATMGKALQAEICKRATGHTYSATMLEFAEAEAAHGEDTTVGGLLASVIKVGKPCGAIMSAGVEAVTGKADHEVTEAAESLGVYGMLLDHAFEVNADLENGASTIVTEMIKRDGDSRQTRKAGRELCLDHANDFRKAGMEGLSDGQRRIYTAMTRLFDVRYRLLVRVQDSLIG